MAQPTYAQLRSLQTSAASVVPETIQERILTVLAMIASGQNPDASTFNLVTPGAGGAGPYVPVTGTYALSTTVVETDSVTGDTNPRLSRNAAGTHSWGPGNAVVDTLLGRSAAGVLDVNLGDATAVKAGKAGPAGQSGFSLQNGEAGSNFYRYAAGSVGVDGSFVLATNNTAIKGINTGAALCNIIGLDFNNYINIGGNGVNRVYVGSGFGLNNGAYAGASNVGGVLSYGTGAPVNASGVDGDIYFRVDGGALTTIYQRRAGVWAGII